MGLSVLHFCPDGSASSGVNCFCRELSQSLTDIGVKSQIIRHSTNLPTSQSPDLPTILHLHGLWLLEHHRAAAWARRHHLPIVWSTHGMTAPWSMWHKWWKKLIAWWLYQKWDLKRTALVHCTTEQEVAWNRRRGLEKTCVVPLGTRGCPEAWRSGGLEAERLGCLEVLFVGRIHPVKGLMNLIRAMGLLKLPVSLLLVGPDEVGYAAELRRECAKLGVEGNVAFVGEKHGEELVQAYENCDVLILPSFTENFGGVVVDALAHGKPVIASKATPWQVLEDGMGWWVANDPETLAETLRKVATLPREQLREMGEKGRRLVAENYTWEAVATKMAKEYEMLLG